jgi:hypothetical protein
VPGMPGKIIWSINIMKNVLNKYQFLNIEKIVQIFSYIQRHAKTTSKLELIKYLFFADRINIRKHFSFISLDRYVALENGPAASSALDILNKYKEYLSNFSDIELGFLDKIQIKNQSTRIIGDMGTDLLSNNEMHSLDLSIQTFPRKNLIEISHDYPEWKRYKELFDDQVISAQPIIIDDFFINPDPNNSPAIQKYFGGKDPLYENEEYLKEAKAFYLESRRHDDVL